MWAKFSHLQKNFKNPIAESARIQSIINTLLSESVVVQGLIQGGGGVDWVSSHLPPPPPPPLWVWNPDETIKN